ncbi:MAG TPA: bifunctional alpha,alpha-trehalose-phosphate synthase (UDP-forming)/trehalose-phosphatase [Candidatus Saccharimonadales bacterium]
MQPGVIIVSNRLPVSVKRVDGKLEFTPSIGGLATGLASYADDRRNKWIGWPGIAADDLSEREREQIADKLRLQNCYPVFLTQKQLDEYYDGYSNSILWPLFHDNPMNPDAAANHDKLWQAYRRVNQAFAEVVLALSTTGTTIWVHDYQLLTLPALLRLERPDDQIGFFLHIPFPSAGNFTKLKSAEAVVAGILGADLVGLHTEGYVNNFLDTVQQLDIGITEHRKVILSNRVVRVTDFPMGIDYDKYEKARRSWEVTRAYWRLKQKYRGQKVILTVDRLDPAKGLVERAEAYRTLLSENQGLRGKVTMIMLVVPSRVSVPEYKALKQTLEDVVNSTNKTFGTPRWQPIEYMFTALPFHEVTALYRRADIAFIAPLRDGMNLVAKEYLASQPRQHGVLILSQTAGAAQELREAIMVDPAEPDSLVQGLYKALAMPRREFKRRVRHMQKHLSSATVQVWAGNFMKSLRKDPALSPVRTWNLNPRRQRELIQDFRRAHTRLLLLDYDGVLMTFHRDFRESEPSPRLHNLLLRLSKLEHTRTVVISGRPRQDLEEWFDNEPLTLVAEHGAYSREAGRQRWYTHKSNATPGWQATIVPILERYARKAPGAFVEVKEQSVVWHYRQVSPYYAQKYLVILKRVLKPYALSLGLQAQQGNMILEVRPTGIDKGSTARHWLRSKPDFVLAIGDDYTDEDTFKAMPNSAYTVKVGRGRTTARYRLPNVDAVLRLLDKLEQKLAHTR